jgi:hypothetical protein
MSKTGTNPDGSERTRLDQLPRVAQLAAWPTPNAMEGGSTSRGGERRDELLIGGLVGWATPRAEDSESAGMRHSRGVADTLTAQTGQGSTSSPAATTKPGVLNPALSRWLMGFPVAWCQAAIRAHRKLKQRPKPARCGSKATATQ